MSFKNAKTKALAIASTALLLVGLIPAAAFAAPAVPTSVNITIHKRSTAAPIGEANNTGEVVADPGGEPLEGAAFDLHSIDTTSLNLSGTTTRDAVVGSAGVWMDNSGTTPAPAGNAGTFAAFQVVSQTYDGATNTWTNSAPTTRYLPVNFASAFTGTTDVNGTISWTGVPAGISTWYVLVESATPANYTTSASSIIASAITNSAGTGYNTDINIYPKNVATTSISKTFTNGTPTSVVKSGDAINYTLEGRFSSTTATPPVTSVTNLFAAGNYGGFRIADVSQALNNLAGNPGVDLSAGVAPTLVQADGSTIDLVAADYTWDAATSTFELTHAGIDKAIANNALSVRVHVTGIVSSAVGQSQAAGVTNGADFWVWAANATPTDPETPPVVIAPSLSVSISKVDQASNAPLAGATFSLMSDAAGSTYLLADGTWGTPTGVNPKLEGTTDAAGSVVFAGVNGASTIADGSGFTCFVKEEAAPAGYQLNVAPEEVTFTNIQHANTASWAKSITVSDFANGTINPNNPVFTLPLTGGTGTIVFSIAGLLLMIGAGVVYARYRKKNQEASKN